MELKFRKLKENEIDARVQSATAKGCILLLYKDARCDMRLLDETVGPMNWQKEYLRDNCNSKVSIWDSDKEQWISKEDTGTESNTEKEKGLASDSFKRACFNWGIGRELYTAPNMFVFAKDLKTLKQDGSRWVCKDSFKVTDIQYIDDKIVYVKVLNLKTNNTIEFGVPASDVPKLQAVEKTLISDEKVKALEEKCKADNVDVNDILKLYKVNSLAELTEVKHANIIQHWDKIKGEK